ncbi:MAG: TraB/GumN family protein [Kiritimatiellae bacterium]|nr:TraB/GumN family protein [Kiritimatiellia bacterium]
MRKRVLCLFAVFGIAALCRGEIRSPLLWKIELPGCAVSWVLGSIHIPSPAITNMPVCVMRAFRESDVMVGEIEFDSATVKEVQDQTMLKTPRDLTAVLPPALYVRCEKYLQRFMPGVPLSVFNQMKLWAFSFSILLLEYQLRYPTIEPMDLRFYRMAQKLGKETGGLETAAEQLSAMESFSDAEIIEMLQLSMDDVEELAKRGEHPIDRLVEAYCSGDTSRIDKEVSRTENQLPEKIRDRFNEVMLVERNKRMAERMIKRMRDAPSRKFFFVIGALHGMDKDSVCELLQKAGARVTRIDR